MPRLACPLAQLRPNNAATIRINSVHLLAPVATSALGLFDFVAQPSGRTPELESTCGTPFHGGSKGVVGPPGVGSEKPW